MFNPIRRTRQHHAIEHATVAILLHRRERPVSVAGLSDPLGFTVVGNFTTDEVEAAAREALERLQAGERWLAYTNQCGTNLWVAGAMSALAVMAVRAGRRKASLSDAVTASVIAGALALPAGRWVQQHITVEADVTGLRTGATGQRHIRGRTVTRIQIASRG